MRYFEKRKARIEIIPMIDIMFFLLVFFIMITLKMIPATGISSHLPQSSTAQALDHPSVVVTLQENGDIALDDQPTSLADLTTRLSSAPDPDKTVLTIAGADAATVQKLMAVMDAARKAGVSHIGLAAKTVQ